MRQLAAPLAIALSMGAAAGVGHAQATDRSTKGLTAVEGLKVGHHTMAGRPTGCTVVLAEAGAVASVDVRGGAPATRETDLLRPENLVQEVHAIVLSGGSAYGLDAATGVMKYLEERGIGYKTRNAVVPIVPGASLIDLSFAGDPKIRPDASCGYRAAQAATAGPVREGNVGAGAGATVGKLSMDMSRAMKAGIGSASIAMPDGLTVSALVAVNAFGDIIDPATGAVVAGVRTPDGRGLADARRLLREGPRNPAPGARENTTIGVVATNARLTKTQSYKIAQMAHDGYARAIAPSHTPYDGDTIFALATGTWTVEPDVALIGSLAADAIAAAIVRAATQAESLGGLPSAKDLKR